MNGHHLLEAENLGVHFGGVVAVVDPRLEEEDALAGDLGPPQPADHLLALA